MALSFLSDGNSRFTDLFDEPVEYLLSPIKGYEKESLLPLTETIKSISDFFHEIDDYVSVALHNSENPADDLTKHESASIYLYTMQFHGGPSLYVLLNQALRAENREELKPWFSFLKLFLTALHKLPSQNKTVWRGIKNVDFSSKYKKGTKFAWWGVSSCTIDIEVLESKHFLGKNGLRTLFSIECINGKYVANHSYFKNKEKEIILMPGSYFEVIGQLNPAPDLHIIQLKEIVAPMKLITPPFNKSTNINPSVVNKTATFLPLTSYTIKQHIVSDVFSKEIPLESNVKLKQTVLFIAGENAQGKKINQLSYLEGIFIDDNETIYIVDCWNHRIIERRSNEKNGRIVAGGNGPGTQTNQLNYPTDVTIDKETDSLIIADRFNRRVMRWSREKNTKNGEIIISNIDCYSITIDVDGSLYVSDWAKNEVRRWKKEERNGTIVAGGHGTGNNHNQLSWPTSIFVDEDYSLYVSDCHNHRIMKWLKDANKGIVVAGGNGQGNNLTQLSYPEGVAVDQLGQIYVADWGNNRVIRWNKGIHQGTIIASYDEQEKQFNECYHPTGLSFDRQSKLYVATAPIFDYNNNLNE